MRFSAYREESPTVVGIIEDARRGVVSGVRRSVESAKYRYLPRFLAESARLSVSAALSGSAGSEYGTIEQAALLTDGTIIHRTCTVSAGAKNWGAWA